jgi:hypothetical protein
MCPIVYENINRIDYVEYKKWVGGNIRVSVYVMYKVIYGKLRKSNYNLLRNFKAWKDGIVEIK